MKPLILLLTLAISASAQEPPPGCDDAKLHPLIYTSQPRAQTPVPPMSDAANWQHANDISRVWEQSEADLVYEVGGKRTVIHDCTGSPEVCTAQEGRLSPDGMRVIYTVSRGDALNISVKGSGLETGLKDFKTKTAELWVYNLINKTKRRLSSGYIDRSPVYASNDTIVFASDRAGTYAPRSTLGRNFYGQPAFQLYRARIAPNGLEDITNITPAEHFVMIPEVLTNGDIAYSAWHGVAPREFGSTPQNHFWICSVDINGNNPRCLLGAHGSGTIKSYDFISDWADPARRAEASTQIRGLRVMAELWPGYLAVSNYYRGNSQGAMGKIFGWEHSEAEGASLEKNIPAMNQWSTSSNPGSGRYVPSTLLNMTPFALDQDMAPVFHKDGRAAGRAGYPFPIPQSWGYGKDAWGFTRTRGWGYESATKELATIEAMGGEPTAKKQIELAFVKQVKNPFDPKQARVLACESLDYHCWDARAVAPYEDFYGIKTPPIAPIAKPTDCELRVVNARMSELHPIPPPPNATPAKIDELKIAFQGNASPDYAAIVDAFGVEYFDHWQSLPTREGLAKSYPPVKAKLLADGSVRMKVDCGRPFQHFGYDAKGNRVASGLAPLAAMGVITCNGCHSGHGEEQAALLKGSAVERFKPTEAGKQ